MRRFFIFFQEPGTCSTLYLFFLRSVYLENKNFGSGKKGCRSDQG